MNKGILILQKASLPLMVEIINTQESTQTLFESVITSFKYSSPPKSKSIKLPSIVLVTDTEKGNSRASISLSLILTQSS